MKPLLAGLSLDLQIEQGGHRFALAGSAFTYVARFPTLWSLVYFSRVLWPVRRYCSQPISVTLEWWLFRLPVRVQA